MIEPEWKRIAGLHVQSDGTIAVVWLAYDRDADTLHLYDCAIFDREVLAVIAEGIQKRGKWIPVAWQDDKTTKEMVNELLNRGVNTTYEGVKDVLTEVVALDIQERMRSKRFKVAKHLTAWLDEFKTFYRQDGVVPKDTHPLMAATRYAVALLEYARAKPSKGNVIAPQIAMV